MRAIDLVSPESQAYAAVLVAVLLVVACLVVVGTLAILARWKREAVRRVRPALSPARRVTL